MKLIHKREVDINKHNNEVKDISVSQGDKNAHFIEMSFLNSGKPLNMDDKEVSIHYELPSKEIVSQKSENGVSTQGNKAIVKIENKVIENPGRILCEFHLEKDGQTAILSGFYIGSRSTLQ